MTNSVSRKQLLEDLLQFAEDIGRTPTKKELDEYGPHYAGLYQEEFGSWNSALEAANLDLNHVHNISREQLMGDIERVSKILDKTPTLDEMDQFGEYSRLTYQRKLGSYVAALEELGLEPSLVQYNFSDVEKPPELQGTKNVRKLQENGPTPGSNLPHSSIGASDKRHGLAKFNIDSGKTVPTEPVYYLFDEHDPENVLRRFFEVNPEILGNRSNKAIVESVGGFGKEWSDAVKGVLAEFEE